MPSLQDDLRRVIRVVSDFPRFGCDFPDITTLFLDPKVFSRSVEALAQRCRDLDVDVVVSTEARGFLVGAPLAAALRLPFVPIRSQRKLPGETVGIDFHGGRFGVMDRFEVHAKHIPKGSRVALVDDVISTGRTLVAASRLVHNVGANVVECLVVLELEDQAGRRKLREKTAGITRKRTGIELFSLLRLNLCDPEVKARASAEKRGSSSALSNSAGAAAAAPVAVGSSATANSSSVAETATAMVPHGNGKIDEVVGSDANEADVSADGLLRFLKEAREKKKESRVVD